MTSSRASRKDRRHLDTRTVLDFLDDRLPAATRQRVEEHLARPCPDCREQLLEISALRERMQSDRTLEVPEWLHRRALSVFVAAPAPSIGERLGAWVAELLFDSRVQPAAAGARRSLGTARRLRFALGGDVTLELEIEAEAAHTQSLRGRLSGEDAALATIEITAGAEHRRVSPDADGGFECANVPGGALSIAVDAPGGRWALPAVDAS